MIRALRRWWLGRRISAAEADAAYWDRGVDAAVAVAVARANEYHDKGEAARKRAKALRLKQLELDYPINTTGVTQ